MLERIRVPKTAIISTQNHGIRWPKEREPLTNNDERWTNRLLRYQYTGKHVSNNINRRRTSFQSVISFLECGGTTDWSDRTEGN